jgi:nucleotide-binding universal stress UspA family protein
MRVLLTTDGSKESCDAIRAGVRLLGPQDRDLDLLYVAPATSRPGAEERLSRQTKRILQDAQRILMEEGSSASANCRTGSPARVILHESKNYDVTVLGAKGRDDRSQGGLGPVASRLVEHADGCVLIGRTPPQDRQPRILVPVDGSDVSEQALDMLSTFFDLESADVTLLHVIESLWLPEDENGEPQEGADQVALQLRLQAEELLARARTRIVSYHPGVSTLVREGVPANEILSAADQGDYDLVVAGATSASDLKHQVLGSVSSKVAWNAPCSVLLVRVPE